MIFNSREALVEARARFKNAYDHQTRKIIVCGGTGCVAGGSLEIYETLKSLMEKKGINVSVTLEEEPHGEDEVGLKKSGCHGFCEMGPLVRIEPQGWLYTKVKVEDCREILHTTVIDGEYIDRLGYSSQGTLYRKQEEIPFYRQQNRVVLEHCGRIDADSIEEYIAIGGYASLEKALFEMSGDQIIEEVKKSILRGRGGGGFPTGKKWEQVIMAAGRWRLLPLLLRESSMSLSRIQILTQWQGQI